MASLAEKVKALEKQAIHTTHQVTTLKNKVDRHNTAITYLEDFGTSKSICLFGLPVTDAKKFEGEAQLRDNIDKNFLRLIDLKLDEDVYLETACRLGKIQSEEKPPVVKLRMSTTLEKIMVMERVVRHRDALKVNGLDVKEDYGYLLRPRAKELQAAAYEFRKMNGGNSKVKTKIVHKDGNLELMAKSKNGKDPWKPVSEDEVQALAKKNDDTAPTTRSSSSRR